MDSPPSSPARSTSAIPNEFTMRELAEKVIAMTGAQSADRAMRRCRPTTRASASPTSALAREMLGWEPKVELDEGLARTIAYFRNQIDELRRAGKAELLVMSQRSHPTG